MRADRPLSASSLEARELTSRAREVIRLLAVLIRNATLHHPDNEVFREPKERLRGVVAEILAREGRFDLEAVGPVLWANRARVRPELRSQPTYRLVADELARRGLGGLRFSAPPPPDAVAALLQLFARRALLAGDPVSAANQLLDAAGVHEVEALPRAREVVGRPETSRRRRALGAYRQALDLIREWMTGGGSEPRSTCAAPSGWCTAWSTSASRRGRGSRSPAWPRSRATTSTPSTTWSTSACSRWRSASGSAWPGCSSPLSVCAPSTTTSARSPSRSRSWTSTAPCPSPSGRRWATTPCTGRGPCCRSPPSDPRVIRRVLTSLQHHRGFTGGGYPDLKILSRQGLFVRIVAIVDAFDAMTTKRVYQRTFLPDEALAMIRSQAGSRFDPVLVKAFINCLGIFPVGSLVQLETGELAVVCEAAPDPTLLDRPTVRLIADSAWAPRPPVSVDLSRPEEAGRRIVRCVDPEPLGIDLSRYVA